MMLLDIPLHDPHSVLGAHSEEGRSVIRVWRPGAEDLFIEVKGKILPTKKVGSGFFICEVSGSVTHQDYRIYYNDGRLAHDPYAFLPTLGEVPQMCKTGRDNTPQALRCRRNASRRDIDSASRPR